MSVISKLVQKFIKRFVPVALAQVLVCMATLAAQSAWATDKFTADKLGLGMTVLGSVASKGSITVFYPSSSGSSEFKRGPFTLQLANGGQPVLGNRRLVVFSHGSGGAPWPIADLARIFVEEG